MSDVTQGLPRVEELFEMRTPKNLSPISEITGKVKVEEKEDGYVVTVRSTKIKPAEEREYFIPLASTLVVKDGDEVMAGTPFAQGYLDPKEILKVGGLNLSQRYVITEVQKVYLSEGAAINNKHIEVIVRQMFSRVKISEAGDSGFVRGDVVEKSVFLERNRKIKVSSGALAKAQQLLMGITKVALSTESVLSAASFQETTRVLINAALEGKVDLLKGLKENVIIGRLIPAGTGFGYVPEVSDGNSVSEVVDSAIEAIS